jgi:hypothetical protein
MTFGLFNLISPRNLPGITNTRSWHLFNKTIPAGIYILLALTLLQNTSIVKAQEKSGTQQNLEYTIKAAFLFNFVKFVDWPPVKEANNVPVTIGIIGKDPFGKAFDTIKDKQVKGRPTVIKYFKSYKDLKTADSNSTKSADTTENLKKCHLLFICQSEKDSLAEITALAQKSSILTVGEMPEMLQSGGIIKFLIEEDKVRFDINLTSARQSSLTIRSQLLRLAKRVIGEEKTDQAEK